MIQKLLLLILYFTERCRNRISSVEDEIWRKGSQCSSVWQKSKSNYQCRCRVNLSVWQDPADKIVLTLHKVLDAFS
jgi:hypothetical protein